MSRIEVGEVRVIKICKQKYHEKNGVKLDTLLFKLPLVINYFQCDFNYHTVCVNGRRDLALYHKDLTRYPLAYMVISNV